MPDKIEKRLRYFDGQFLKAEDFTDEQLYHVDRARRHSRFLHTPGIVNGLSVTAEIGSDNVVVGAGTALDSDGRQIYLADPRTVSTAAHADKTMLLVISYDEAPSDQTEEGVGGHTRWHEWPRVELIDETSGLDPETHIRLATLALDGTGKVKEPQDEAVRVDAGVKMRGQAELSRLLLKRTGDARASWPSLSCGDTGRADLDGDLLINKSLSVVDRAKFQADVRVAGNALLEGNATLKNATLGDGTDADLLFFKTSKPWKLTAGSFAGNATLDLQSTVSDKSFRVVSPNGQNVPLQVNAANGAKQAVYLVQSGGNVGVGTTDPKATLDISGSVNVNGPLTVTDTLSFGQTTRQMINLWRKGYGIGVQGYTHYCRTDADFAWFKGGTHADGRTDPGGGTVQMVIKAGGRVGIGLPAPQARLHVTGRIRAELNAIPGNTNNYHLELFSPDTGQPTHYTKLRFHHANQYWGWLGYHVLTDRRTDEEFVFWNQDAGRPARIHVSKLRLANKWLLSGIGDGHANDGWLRVMNRNGADYYGGVAAGRLWSRNGTVEGSDSRSKRSVRGLGACLQKVLSLRGVRFTWKDQPQQGPQIGLVAQEVEKVFPELVEIGPDGMKGLRHSGLIAPLVEALKEQHARVEALEARLAEFA